MDLKKELVARNKDLRRLFELIDRLEPVLDYDEDKEDYEYNSVEENSAISVNDTMKSSTQAFGITPKEKESQKKLLIVEDKGESHDQTSKEGAGTASLTRQRNQPVHDIDNNRMSLIEQDSKESKSHSSTVEQDSLVISKTVVHTTGRASPQIEIEKTSQIVSEDEILMAKAPLQTQNTIQTSKRPFDDQSNILEIQKVTTSPQPQNLNNFKFFGSQKSDQPLADTKLSPKDNPSNKQVHRAADQFGQRATTEISHQSTRKSPNKVDLKLSQNEIDLIDDIKERMLVQMREDIKRQHKEKNNDIQSSLTQSLKKTMDQKQRSMYDGRTMTGALLPEEFDEVSGSSKKLILKLRHMLQMKMEDLKQRKKGDIKVTSKRDREEAKDNLNQALKHMGTAFGLTGPQLAKDKKNKDLQIVKQATKSKSLELDKRVEKEEPDLAISRTVSSTSVRSKAKKYEVRDKFAEKILTKLDNEKNYAHKDKLAQIVMDQIDFQDSGVTQRSEPDQFTQMVMIAQAQGAQSVFQGLGKKDLEGTKRGMIRRLNDFTDKRKQKEEQLAKLYSELEAQTAGNVMDEYAQYEIDQKINHAQNKWKQQKKSALVQSKVEQALISEHMIKEPMRYNDRNSCLQRKQLLEKKLKVVEQRCREEEEKHARYNEMLKKGHTENWHHNVKNNWLSDQESSLNQVVADLDQLNHIGRQRDYQLKAVHLETCKKIRTEQQKMDRLEKERQEQLKQEEIDTQQILFRILQHTRQIKRGKQVMKTLIEKKQFKLIDKEEVFRNFAYFQEQVKILATFAQLRHMIEYREKISKIELAEITSDGKANHDRIRIFGLSNIEALEEDIFFTKFKPCFEIIYPTKTALRGRDRKNIKKKIQKARMKLKTLGTFAEKGKSNEYSSGNNSDNSQCLSHESVNSNPSSHKPSEQKAVSNWKVTHNDKKESSKTSSTGHHTESVGALPHDDVYLFPHEFVQQSRLEYYIMKQDKFDKQFMQMVKLSEGINDEKIIKIYNHSNIKFTSLRSAFTEQEAEKVEKLIIKPQLENKVEYLQKELTIIGDYIKNLGLGKSLQLKKLDSEGTANFQSDIYRPVSIEGHQLFIEQLSIKNRFVVQQIAHTKDLIKEFNSGFQFSIKYAVTKLNEMQEISKSKIDFDNDDVANVKSLFTKYSNKEELAESKMKFRSLRSKVFGAPKPEKQDNLISKAIQVVKDSRSSNQEPTQTKSFEDDSDSSYGTQSHGDNKSKAHSGQNHQKSNNISMKDDILKLFEVFDGAFDRIQISKKFMKKIHTRKSRGNSPDKEGDKLDSGAESGLSNSPLKVNLQKSRIRAASQNPHLLWQQIGKAVFDEDDNSVSLEDFDPVYRKNDQVIVKQGAMLKLNLEQSRKDRQSMTQKQKNKYKEQARKRMDEIAQYEDPDRDEFDQHAIISRARQLNEAEEKRKRIEDKEIEADIANMNIQNRPTSLDNDNSDGNSARSSNNSSVKRRRYLRKLERQQAQAARFQGFLDEYNDKKIHIRTKQQWFKQKQAAQSIQRNEQFFIEDLKSKINSRYDKLRQSFIQKYELRPSGPAKKGIHALMAEPSRPEHIGSAGSLKSLQETPRERKSKTGQGSRNQQDRLNHSQKRRVNKLYTSLVGAASNLGKLDLSNQQDQYTQSIFGNIKKDIQNESTKSPAGFDINKVANIISQQFLSPMNRGTTAATQMTQKNQFSPVVKKPQTAGDKVRGLSMKERIELNRELTKSVKLKPRKTSNEVSFLQTLSPSMFQSPMGVVSPPPINPTRGSLQLDTKMTSMGTPRAIKKFKAQEGPSQRQSTKKVNEHYGTIENISKMPISTKHILQNTKTFSMNQQYNLTYGTVGKKRK